MPVQQDNFATRSYYLFSFFFSTLFPFSAFCPLNAHIFPIQNGAGPGAKRLPERVNLDKAPIKTEFGHTGIKTH